MSLYYPQETFISGVVRMFCVLIINFRNCQPPCIYTVPRNILHNNRQRDSSVTIIYGDPHI